MKIGEITVKIEYCSQCGTKRSEPECRSCGDVEWDKLKPCFKWGKTGEDCSIKAKKASDGMNMTSYIMILIVLFFYGVYTG